MCASRGGATERPSRRGHARSEPGRRAAVPGFRREAAASREVSGALTTQVLDADPDAATPRLASASAGMSCPVWRVRTAR